MLDVNITFVVEVILFDLQFLSKINICPGNTAISLN